MIHFANFQQIFIKYILNEDSSLEDSTFIKGSLTKGESMTTVYSSVPADFSNIIESLSANEPNKFEVY